MALYVGTSGYSYPKWKGKFYPKTLPNDQMLRYYADHFRAVEINNTFYAMPKAALLEKWAEDVPADFKFPLKAPQKITHVKRLKEADELVAQFVEAAGVLKKRLGPLLFQLPPNFKKDVPRLQTFLTALPAKTRAAFEFRHASWFDDEVFAVLRARKVALCIAQEDEELKVPFVATADWGYLRLRMPDYTTAELKAWVKQVQQQDWQDAFVFFKHDDDGKGPGLAEQFLKLAG